MQAVQEDHRLRPLEDWQIRLIRHRAKRLGCTQEDLDDIQQELTLEAPRFPFRPQQSNGAAPSTAFCACVDRWLLQMRRSQRRLRNRGQQYGTEWGREHRRRVNARRFTGDLALDVKEALVELSEQEQEVCKALAAGVSKLCLARTLGVSRFKMERMVANIREKFAKAGLEAWVDKR